MKPRVFIAWIFLVGTLFACLMYIGINMNKENKDYYALEADLIEYAGAYIDLNDISLSQGEQIKIEIDKLIELNLIDELKVKSDICEGYILVKKKVTDIDIKPFIKCDNYESLDYDKYKSLH